MYPPTTIVRLECAGGRWSAAGRWPTAGRASFAIGKKEPMHRRRSPRISLGLLRAGWSPNCHIRKRRGLPPAASRPQGHALEQRLQEFKRFHCVARASRRDAISRVVGCAAFQLRGAFNNAYGAIRRTRQAAHGCDWVASRRQTGAMTGRAALNAKAGICRATEGLQPHAVLRVRQPRPAFACRFRTRG